jgi:hypothetical protein
MGPCPFSLLLVRLRLIYGQNNGSIGLINRGTSPVSTECNKGYSTEKKTELKLLRFQLHCLKSRALFFFLIPFSGRILQMKIKYLTG